MKLSRKKAIKLCIELWEWLAKTGKEKSDWPGWEKYDHACSYCWFCEYDRQQEKRYIKQSNCSYCPLVKRLGIKCDESFYDKWENAKTPRTRKKYAKLFLGQIRQTL